MVFLLWGNERNYIYLKIRTRLSNDSIKYFYYDGIDGILGGSSQ